MRVLQVTLLAAILLAAAITVLPAHDCGATIDFTDLRVRMYEGAGDARAPEPTDQPIVVGNLRITAVQLPSEAKLEYVGLVFPFRALLDEAGVNLDRTWGSSQPVALICEAIDVEAPISFRLRAHARRRMMHAPGAWLELQLGRDARDSDAIPAMVQNRRAGGEGQHWYIDSDLPTILRLDEPETDRFAILLNAGGRGSFWVKSIEIKPWPPADSR